MGKRKAGKKKKKTATAEAGEREQEERCVAKGRVGRERGQESERPV